ncbi:MAG: AzlD domain-containing protein [Pseudomonadota bacterium]
MIEDHNLWIVIIGLGIGSYLLRFTFLGIVGNRPMPEWFLRHLRYTAVAIIPALVTPIIAFSGDNGWPEPARLTASIVTVLVCWITKNVLIAIAAGLATLYTLLYLLG